MKTWETRYYEAHYKGSGTTMRVVIRDLEFCCIVIIGEVVLRVPLPLMVQLFVAFLLTSLADGGFLGGGNEEDRPPFWTCLRRVPDPGGFFCDIFLVALT